MEPRFQDGDIVFIMPSAEPRNGDVVICKFKDNGIALKILQVAGHDQVTLSSYNPAYPPSTFKGEDFQWIYPIHSVLKLVKK